MALSLSAEQKNLRDLFINDDRYIIPSFQRPYSWTQKEVKQLYDDISRAFSINEDYFVGNIVIANSNKNNSHPHIIDGQQRIITLWLFTKVLSQFSTNAKLKRMLNIEDDNGNLLSKIDSEVFEAPDQISIADITKWETSDFQNSSRWFSGKPAILRNAKYIFSCVEEFWGRASEDLKSKFVSYFLNNIYLLPIELDGKDIEDATSKALTIFETINNRGLDLADADILKAKLYEMASADSNQAGFIDAWKRLGTRCQEIDVEINDVFRYYLRIIRAHLNQTTSEPNLRNFFLSNPDSPLKIYNWEKIMSDLNSIGDALDYINNMRSSSPQWALLLNILEAHPSKLPYSALVIFTHRLLDSDVENQEKEVLVFLEELIKDIYSYDNSLEIKYRIFEICSAVVNSRKWQRIRSDLPEQFFDDRKRMRAGFVILYHYLAEPSLNDFPSNRTEYPAVRIARDTDANIGNWNAESLKDDLMNMANFSIVDFPSNNKPLSERSHLYNSSSLISVRNILNGEREYSYENFLKRKNDMENVLFKFFTAQ